MTQAHHQTLTDALTPAPLGRTTAPHAPTHPLTGQGWAPRRAMR